MSATRIKICGITNASDAELVAEAGADAIGINFYSGSPRFVSEEMAAMIVHVLPPFVEPIALFVNEPLERAAEFIQPFPRIRTIQWHGDNPEPPGGVRIIAAFAVKDAESVKEMERYMARCREADSFPAAILVDGSAAGKYGGTGIPAPWTSLADFRPGVPLILAGGLTPENVAVAIDIVRPYAVDVASGVESAPGKKDPEKVRRFIDAVRNA